MADKVTFEIGLTLAGAISAGAYSGGVFDFLCEALAEWQKAKDAGQADIPSHDVCIKVVSGASAGSVTMAMGVIALAQGMSPNEVPGKPGYRYQLKSLYDGWVVDPDLASQSGAYDLLSLEDLAGKGPVTSVLNATCLDQITKKALAAKPTSATYPWLAEPLHAFFTVTNLRGVPYKVSFQGPGGDACGHYMMSHGDRVHFAVAGLGGAVRPNTWCTEDPATTVPKNTLGTAAPDWQSFADGALASSAFPIGLAPRRITATLADYAVREWPMLQPSTRLGPAFPDGFPDPPATKTMDFNAPDGGVIDNEPFEYAHSGVLADGTDHNPTEADLATRAVIMIDPFPEPPDFQTDNAKATDPSLLKIPGALITALKNQARFKPDEIAAALNEETYSRYLVAPLVSDQAYTLSSKPLATALLGGFGGFIDQSFREHDYQLGRRNCQQFLREHFAVGLNNPIASTWSAVAKQNFRDHGKTHLQVIPLMGALNEEIPLPPWPRIPYSRLLQIEARLKTRADGVVAKLLTTSVRSRLLRWVVEAVWGTAARSKVLDAAHWAILSELIGCDQLQELQALTKDERAAAVALCDFDFDYRSAGVLTKILGKAPDYLVDKLNATPVQLWHGTVNGQDCYCWADRRPGFLARTLSGATPEIG